MEGLGPSRMAVGRAGLADGAIGRYCVPLLRGMPAKIWKLEARQAFEQIRKKMEGSNGRGGKVYIIEIFPSERIWKTDWTWHFSSGSTDKYMSCDPHLKPSVELQPTWGFKLVGLQT